VDLWLGFGHVPSQVAESIFAGTYITTIYNFAHEEGLLVVLRICWICSFCKTHQLDDNIIFAQKNRVIILNADLRVDTSRN
jgi:hypothetical protein